MAEFEIAVQEIKPIVCRFSKEKHVDAFFNTGELRLSSFESFSNHKDEKRKDTSEANAVHTIRTKSGQTGYVVLKLNEFKNALVLCGTANDYLRSSWYKPRNRHAIQIHDPLSLAVDVAIQLREHHGIEITHCANGYCIYRKAGLEHLADSINVKQLDGMSDQERMVHYINFLGPRHFFRKGLKYSHEVEYRWIWFSKTPCPTNVTVNIPEPSKYCNKKEIPSYREMMSYKLFGKSAKEMIKEAHQYGSKENGNKK